MPTITPPTNREIYNAYVDCLAARKHNGFDQAGARAIEDTAWMLDISIKDVCVAISLGQDL